MEPKLKFDNNKTYDEFNLSFIHFNDVYNVVPNNVEPVGGASRFVCLVKSLKESNPDTIVLFSGDIFAPSVMSSVFKGEQMIPVIDEIQIDVACVGNHDYDFGIEGLQNLVKKTRGFPWLLSNLLDPHNGKPILPGTELCILEKNGIKIGLMGLIEYDWVLTQSAFQPEEYIYEDFIKVAKKLVNYFKSENCDLIIALTHMRNYNDINLSEAVPEIDLILGGHDHDFFYKTCNNNLILKSGTDFRELTFNKLTYYKYHSSSNIFQSDFKQLSDSKFISTITKEKYQFVIETEYIQVTKNMRQDEAIAKFVNILEAKTEEKFKHVIGHLAGPVDARFSMVRNQSIPLNNFIADIVNIYMNTDCTIINSGSLRIDSIINEGELTFGVLKRLLPGDYNLVRIKLSGLQIWKTLENGVSKFPALEGRYPIISNITFSFNPTQISLQRIDPESVFIKGEKLRLDEQYTLSTRVYTYNGFDGFDELPKCENIDHSDLDTIFDVSLKFFEIVESLRPNVLENRNCSECKQFPTPGIFGFDHTNHKLKDFLRETVIFSNETPLVVISSQPRIFEIKNIQEIKL